MRIKPFNSYAVCILISCFMGVNSWAQPFAGSVKNFIKVQSPTIALTHAKIIDGTGGPVKEQQTIIIQNGMISALGNTGSVAIPSDAKVIDCSGKSIIPGMVMMHEHLFYGEAVPPFFMGQQMPISFPQLYLAGGVTTMRTAGSQEPQTDINLKKSIEDGILIGPDMDVTALYIERAGLPIPQLLHIKSPDQAAEVVNFWAKMGCTSFKLYQNATRADARAAIHAAHKLGLKVTGHLCSITFREATDLGIDNLEHGFMVCSDFAKDKIKDECNRKSQRQSLLEMDPNSPEMKELMRYLIKKNVAITSTLPVFEPYTGYDVFVGDGGDAVTPPIKEKVEAHYATILHKDSTSHVMFKKEMFWEKQFVDMGGRLMAGIDPTGSGRVIPGYADRVVPELLMQAGFSLELAIKICSLNAAEYLGREKEIGSIAVGKKADLVLINGDIESDIKNMRNTEIVFKNGVGWDSKKIFDSMKGLVGLY